MSTRRPERLPFDARLACFVKTEESTRGNSREACRIGRLAGMEPFHRDQNRHSREIITRRDGELARQRDEK
jgi:hypothetical protein